MREAQPNLGLAAQLESVGRRPGSAGTKREPVRGRSPKVEGRGGLDGCEGNMGWSWVFQNHKAWGLLSQVWLLLVPPWGQVGTCCLLR